MGNLNSEKVKVLIKASQIAREHGITKGASVKEICDKAGISRKTGYKWINEAETLENKDNIHKSVHLQVDHQKLLKKYNDLRVENEGIRLAMEIHGFDEFIQKKRVTGKIKK
jgi:transposase